MAMFALFLFFSRLFADDKFEPPTHNTTFLEEDGLLIMEAESVPIVSPWVFETNPTVFFTGDGFLRLEGEGSSGGPPMGRLSYFFEITTPGYYRMAIRSYKNNRQIDLANDCYTKLVGHEGYQGEDTKIYRGGLPYIWGWAVDHEVGEEKVETEYNLTVPGVYELQITGRSPQFRMDRIVLFESSQMPQWKAFGLWNSESARDD